MVCPKPTGGRYGSIYAGSRTRAGIGAGRRRRRSRRGRQRADRPLGNRVQHNDVDALVKLYAPEAILLSSVDPSIHEGTAAIPEYYANAKVQASGSKVVEVSERRMTVLSDVAVVCTGLWEFTFMRDGKPVVNSARFTMVLVKRGSDWMIVNHHSSGLPKPL
jgi:hypothetical protein